MPSEMEVALPHKLFTLLSQLRSKNADTYIYNMVKWLRGLQSKKEKCNWMKKLLWLL